MQNVDFKYGGTFFKKNVLQKKKKMPVFAFGDPRDEQNESHKLQHSSLLLRRCFSLAEVP